MIAQAKLRAFLLSLLGCFTASTALAQVPEDDLDMAREALSEWVETKKLISEERNTWKTEKEIIKDTIATLEEEVETLDAQIEEAEEEASSNRSAREELNLELEELRAITGNFEPVIAELEKELVALLPYLPEPLLDSMTRLTDQLPIDGKPSRHSINQRAVFVMGVLQKINDFNSGVNVYQQLIELPGQNAREFSVIYPGLAAAYFVDETETAAGRGRPTADGWVWEQDNSIIPQVHDAVQIREKQMLARFVDLPITIED
ncbi:MAG: DUF3450 family protein [Opitutales bacterium]